MGHRLAIQRLRQPQQIQPVIRLFLRVEFLSAGIFLCTRVAVMLLTMSHNSNHNSVQLGGISRALTRRIIARRNFAGSRRLWRQRRSTVEHKLTKSRRKLILAMKRILTVSTFAAQLLAGEARAGFFASNGSSGNYRRLYLQRVSNRNGSFL